MQVWGHNSLTYLGDLRRQGLSASEIGAIFGVTRNSIIGAWTRHADIVFTRTDLDALLKDRTAEILSVTDPAMSLILDTRKAA